MPEPNDFEYIDGDPSIQCECKPQDDHFFCPLHGDVVGPTRAHFDDGAPVPPCPKCGGVLVDHPRVDVDGVWCPTCHEGFSGRALRALTPPVQHDWAVTSPTHTDLMASPESFTICEKCGDVVPLGGWPFCASERNPGGHSGEVSYHWEAGFGMRSQGWTRRGR